MPAPAGLPERLRRPPGPHGRQLPLRAHEHPRAAPAALRPRDHGARDDLAHPDRVAGRPGPAGRAARGGRRAGAPTTGVPPATPPPPAPSCGWPPASRATSRWWSTPCPSSSTGLQTGTWDYDGDGYETMTVPPAGRRPGADRDVDHPPRRGGRPLLRPLDARQGRDRLRLAVVVRRPAHRTWTRRRRSSTPRSATGGTGSPTAPSPTIRGAATWSAAR